MSDRPIQVGDLVQVVRGHRCAIGKIFCVASFSRSIWEGYKCLSCGEEWEYLNQIHDVKTDCGRFFELFRLRRIPPLSELEGQRTEESFREPSGKVKA